MSNIQISKAFLVIYIFASMVLLLAFTLNYNRAASNEIQTIQNKIDKTTIDNSELKRKYMVEMRKDLSLDKSYTKAEPGQMLQWKDVALEGAEPYR